MPDLSLVEAEAKAPPEYDYAQVPEERLVETVDLDEDHLDERIKSFFKTEIPRAAKALRSKWQQYKEYREQYDEYLVDKDFPWEDASNIAVPMTAPYVNQAVGKAVSILRSIPNPVRVVALPGSSSGMKEGDQIQGIQDLLNANLIQDKKNFGVMQEIIQESTVVGTCVGKVFWENKKKKIRAFGIVDGAPTVVDDWIPYFRGNKVEPIRIEDFILPPEGVTNPNAIEEGQWVAQRFREREGVVREKVNQGVYRPGVMEQIEHWQDQMDPEEGNIFLDQAEMRELGTLDAPEDSSSNELTLYEIHCKFPMEQGGKEEEIVIVYSWKHDIVLSAIYAPYFHGERPFIPLRYWPLANSFFGIGIPHQVRHPQAAANAITNQGIDANTLANTGVWVSSKQSGVKPGKNDRIWAGRWLQLDEPDSFKRMDMGSASPLTLDFISLMDKTGQRGAGMDDVTAGMGGGGGERAAEAAMVSEGKANPMFKVIMGGVFDFVAKAAEFSLSNYQQYSPMGDEYLATASNGQAVIQELQLPRETVVGKYRYSVQASTLSANPEIRKASLQHLMSTINPLYEGLMGKLGQLVSKQTPDAALPLMIASIRSDVVLARQLIQANEMPGAEDLIPEWESFWQKAEPAIMQAREAAKKAPDPLDETIGRKMAPDWVDQHNDTQIETLTRLGFSAAKLKQLEAGGGNAGLEGSGGPMGGPPPAGSGGVP